MSRGGGRTPGGRPIYRLGAIVGVAVAVFSLLGPTTLAAPALTPARTAPYRGSVVTGSDTLTPLLSGPCALSILYRQAGWHPAAGEAGWDERVAAHGTSGCSGPNSTFATASASAHSQLTLAVPIGSPANTGTHDVVANWTIQLTAHWTIAHPACPAIVLTSGNGYQDCSVDAAFSVSGPTPTLVDLSTGASLAGSGAFSYHNVSRWVLDESCATYYGYTTCTTTNSSFGGGTHALVVHLSLLDLWNATILNASHRYAVEFTFSGGVDAQLYGSPQAWNASASASLNLWSKGNGLFLNSVAIQ